MCDHDDVGVVFGLHVANEILDMGPKADLWGGEVPAFTDACPRGREELMP